MTKSYGSFLVTALIVVFLSHAAFAYTTEQVNKARAYAHMYKEEYWKCLAREALKMLNTRISSQEFQLYLTTACPAEKQKFRVPLIDYLSMTNTDMTVQDAFSSADYVMKLAQDEVVKEFIEMRIKGN